jgi:hypothetical protein
MAKFKTEIATPTEDNARLFVQTTETRNERDKRRNDERDAANAMKDALTIANTLRKIPNAQILLHDMADNWYKFETYFIALNELERAKNNVTSSIATIAESLNLKNI